MTDAIRSAAPAIVLVGLGAPKQERWITRHADAFPSVRVTIGVGGAFDMWAGSTPRASRLPNARARVDVAVGARTAAAAHHPCDRRLPRPRGVRSDRRVKVPPHAPAAGRAAQRRDDQVGRASYLEAKQDVDVACFRDHAERPWERDAGARGRGAVGTPPFGPPPRLELRGTGSAQHRAEPEPGDDRSRFRARRLGGYDAVFVDGWLMAQYVPDAFAGLRLLHEHNAEHVMWRRHTELETHALRRSLVRVEPAASAGTRPAAAAVRRGVRGSSATGRRWPRSPRRGPRSPCSPTSRIRRCSSARS